MRVEKCLRMLLFLRLREIRLNPIHEVVDFGNFGKFGNFLFRIERNLLSYAYRTLTELRTIIVHNHAHTPVNVE